MSMYASASRCATAWKPPIGLPNCTRVRAYSAVSSSARSVTPACSAHSPTVAALTSQPARAPSGPPSTRSPGSRTSSSTTRPALSPLVSCCRCTVTPASPGVTRKTVTPSGVAAGTRISPASGAAGTVVLTPDSRQPAPSPGHRLGAGRGCRRVVPVLLGQGGGQDQLPAPRRRGPAALLVRGAEPGDRAGAEHDRGQVGDRREGAPQLGQDRALLQQAEPGPAQRFGQRGGQDAGAGQGGPQPGIEPVPAGLGRGQLLRRHLLGEDLPAEGGEFGLAPRSR